MPRRNPIPRTRAIAPPRGVSISGRAASSAAELLGVFLEANAGYGWLPVLGNVYTDRSATPSVPAVASDPIGTITEYTGIGPAAIATADATRPILTTASGRYWGDYDGTDDRLAIGDLSVFAGSACTLVTVSKLVPTGGVSYEVMHTQGNDTYYLFTGDGLSYPGNLRVTRIEAQPALPSNATTTMTIRHSAGGWNRRVDGTQDISVAGVAFGTALWGIGSANVAGTPARWWKGQIWGVAAVPSALSDANTATFESLMLALAQ